MINVRCKSCGEFFWRELDEDWKALCLPCWRARKRQPGNPSWVDPGEVAWLRARVHDLESELERLRELALIGQELQDRFRDFLFLTHPDKHGGDQRALEISQWLIGEVRDGG